jgi:intracellular sulfur oxidation DsrE/DsrF family protein
MGLLDDLFGKEKINQLKELLDEKSQEASLAELNLAQAKFDLNEVSNLVVEIKEIVTDRENVIESLKKDLNKQQSENLQLVSESQALQVLVAEKQSQSESVISNLQALLEKSKFDLLEREKITKAIESSLIYLIIKS